MLSNLNSNKIVFFLMDLNSVEDQNQPAFLAKI